MEEKNLTDLLEELGEELEGLEEEHIAVPMDFENVGVPQYETKAFKQGVADVSRLAGQITGLKNMGLSEDGVLALMGMLYEKEIMPSTMKHNETLAKIQAINLEKATI